jgi:hypothetical protein
MYFWGGVAGNAPGNLPGAARIGPPKKASDQLLREPAAPIPVLEMPRNFADMKKMP